LVPGHVRESVGGEHHHREGDQRREVEAERHPEGAEPPRRNRDEVIGEAPRQRSAQAEYDAHAMS
jgi:hypothetical protein